MMEQTVLLLVLHMLLMDGLDFGFSSSSFVGLGES